MQIMASITAIGQLFPDELFKNKKIVIQFEGEAKNLNEGLGLPFCLSVLSSLELIKLKKKDTGIGDIELFGNILPTSYIPIKIANAKRIGFY
ncbi:MAG: hypothetical protein ACTSVB_08465 [Candidatus Heimdallarchaeaceae archaeon]